MVYDDRIMRMADSVPQRTARPDIGFDRAGPVRETGRGVNIGFDRAGPVGQPRNIGIDRAGGYGTLNDLRQLAPENTLRDYMNRQVTPPGTANEILLRERDRLFNIWKKKAYTPGTGGGLLRFLKGIGPKGVGPLGIGMDLLPVEPALESIDQLYNPDPIVI